MQESVAACLGTSKNSRSALLVPALVFKISQFGEKQIQSKATTCIIMQISIMTLNLRTEQYFCSLLFPRSLIIMLSVNSFNKLNLLFFKCQQAKHRQQPSNLHVSVTLFLHFCGWILFRITLSFSHLN